MSLNPLSKRKPVQLPEDIYWHLSAYALMHGNLGLGEAIEDALKIADENGDNSFTKHMKSLVNEALIHYIYQKRGNSLLDYSKQITEDGVIHEINIKIRRDIIIRRLRVMLKEGEINKEALKARIGDEIDIILEKGV